MATTAPFLEFPVLYGKLDLERQSLEMPGTKRPGQTAHYRNASHPFIEANSPGTIHNFHEVFENGLYYSGAEALCLGERKLISKNPVRWSDSFEWQTYGTVDARRRAVGAGLYKLFQDGTLSSGALRTVGIWSRNIPNWQIVDLGLHLYHLVNVALYDTLGKDSVEYVINHAETSIIFASTQNIPLLLALVHKVPCLKIIVAMEELEPDVKTILTTWAQSQNIRLMLFSEIEELGSVPLPPSGEAIATICYTSGTTGVPKGALLSQQAMCSAAHCLMYGAKYEGEPLVEFSYLPLAHIFERIVALSTLTGGGCIGYGTGDPLRLIEDMQLIRPTILVSVPRVMNRVVAAAMATSTAGGLKGTLFNWAVQTKLQNFHANGETKHSLWDRVVFKKIQAVLGGRVKLLGLGSAPMSPASLEFLKIALGCDIIEGYGCTENCGAGSRANAPDFTSAGTVGPPNISMEFKLVDVPALGYTSEDKPNPRGEICTRGVNNFNGYYKDEANTKAALDDEGWLHTGDVGELDSKGRFTIIDRVKNIMKLSQGEYVAVEKIESVYSASPVAAQLFVYGDSLQSYLIAILIPDPLQLAPIASKVLGTTISPTETETLKEVVQDEKVIDALLHELDREAKKNGLKGFEKIKRIHVTLDLFTVEEGTITPTLKIRRKEAYKKYKQEIDTMYALPEPTRSPL
ncbi:hypothetical protein EIP91_006291 [Steccherinum ochraceum]|uniref:AMP-dependent synthetase/ligase domain-containing protein n=1 Tax=Steccherinum ochraceum TaxID=92696 RepID=A0A4R0RTJ9_9APHY|nr:hypothetical protein EIP91_006291 [Steccherinum ochraceum]